MKIAGYIF